MYIRYSFQNMLYLSSIPYQKFTVFHKLKNIYTYHIQNSKKNIKTKNNYLSFLNVSYFSCSICVLFIFSQFHYLFFMFCVNQAQQRHFICYSMFHIMSCLKQSSLPKNNWFIFSKYCTRQHSVNYVTSFRRAADSPDLFRFQILNTKIKRKYM